MSFFFANWFFFKHYLCVAKHVKGKWKKIKRIKDFHNKIWSVPVSKGLGLGILVKELLIDLKSSRFKHYYDTCFECISIGIKVNTYH